VHRDNHASILEHLGARISSLLWPHSKFTTDCQKQVARLVQLINKCHVPKNPSITAVIDTDSTGESYNKPSCIAAVLQEPVVHPTRTAVVCVHHRYSAKAEFKCAGLVHAVTFFYWDLLHVLKVGLNFPVRKNLTVRFCAGRNKKRS
jgi:hypothetical protein